MTPEYREERDRLKERLTSGLVPKEKNGQYNYPKPKHSVHDSPLPVL